MTRLAIPLIVGGVLALTACGGDDTADLDEPAATVSPLTTIPATLPRELTSGPTIDITVATTQAPREPTTTATGAAPSPTPTTPETTMPPPVPGEMPPIVEQAVADLAGRLDVDPATIEVVSVEEVDWPDGSIGCPQPGMVYTQAIVNGSKIVLRHDGTEYDYHQGGSRPVFYCPPDRVVEP